MFKGGGHSTEETCLPLAQHPRVWILAHQENMINALYQDVQDNKPRNSHSQWTDISALLSVHQGLRSNQEPWLGRASLVSGLKAKKTGSLFEIDGKIVNEGKNKEADLTISKSAILATANDFFPFIKDKLKTIHSLFRSFIKDFLELHSFLKIVFVRSSE